MVYSVHILTCTMYMFLYQKAFVALIFLRRLVCIYIYIYHVIYTHTYSWLLMATSGKKLMMYYPTLVPIREVV